ncbi:MAG: hypothetical protein HN403_01740 [Rhodospirillales bacterium]|jgi:endonuclease/exonuclease/phosphatase family metal-dependent hydrolase|nr:hypothetical protein [Rhodospirillales bacterium]
MSRLEIVSWNIQAGRGGDGCVDLDRIANTVREFGEPDIICFQEVARHMPGVTGGADVDQAAELSARYSDFEAVFRPSVDLGQRQFGCMIFSRFPVLQIRNHLLPRPSVGEPRSMQRQALEATIDVPGGPLRVTTTHLEFNSSRHQDVQVNRLREIHRDASRRAKGKNVELTAGQSPYYEPPSAEMAVACGDFNFVPESNMHEHFVAEFTDGASALVDAWEARYAGTPHPDTCGISDRNQWPQGPHCRDFFFVTDLLAQRISTVDVNQHTEASDHQPIRIVFEE